jgi:hypothetical protein
VKRAENLTLRCVREKLLPGSKHAKTPAWPTEPYENSVEIEIEVYCGDVGKVAEVQGSFREVVRKRGSLTTEEEF